uniref:Uncharacterized protein n=1 Tax=Oryza barthii TaxID=65489 RepID=A0A0D3FRZ3_9ORYZ
MVGGQGCCCCIVCCILVDVILTRLDLAGANGTGLAYSILLTVIVHNPNVAVHTEYTQPLVVSEPMSAHRQKMTMKELGGGKSSDGEEA